MKHLFSILFIFIFSLNYLAQETLKTEWTNIGNAKDDFSILLPPDFIADNDADSFRASALQDQVSFELLIQKNEYAKTSLKNMRKDELGDKYTFKRLETDNFKGIVYSLQENNYLSFVIYLASSKNYYRISASSLKGRSAALEKFLYSIKLNKEQIFKQTGGENQESSPIIDFSAIKSSPLVLEALKTKPAEKINVRAALDKKVPDLPTDLTNYSRPLFMLRKPRPSYTDSARQNQISGKVILQVVFRADGQINDIIVIQMPDKSLAGQAAEAARNIKFLPAQVDGKSVAVTRRIEYTFTIY